MGVLESEDGDIFEKGSGGEIRAYARNWEASIRTIAVDHYYAAYQDTQGLLARRERELA